ncbi:PepSY domain-containing protein [Thalassotalea piscium]|uniref:Putative membrane protein YkoI n=1 Tax=Thalassotalea piscium TaxID=1230533 RepID=A0A7X0NJH3_9GAMM|nr:PepSY domain-containing protein [Thalassotalea piscium]MBB6544578.1 putative membrane protein YkoI [Thalassotalea piscium]
MKSTIGIISLMFVGSLQIAIAADFGQTTINSQAEQKSNKTVKNSRQAASVVKKQYGGKVLRVNKQKSDYKVKILKPNGHVISKKVDAKTGKIKKD